MKKTLFLGMLVLAGCADLKPDYVAPAAGPTATVDVGEVAGVVNRRILVRANKPVAISMPWSDPSVAGVYVKTEYCQPVAVFTPLEGRRYRLDFASCSAILSDDRGASAPAPIYQGCDLGIPQDDASRVRMFFLRPKK